MAIAAAMQPATGTNALARKLESNNSYARVTNDLTERRIFAGAAASARRLKSLSNWGLRPEQGTPLAPPTSVASSPLRLARPFFLSDKRGNAALSFICVRKAANHMPGRTYLR